MKKRRSSGNNTLEYLKERNERIDELRKQQLELKKQDWQQEERKNENMMKLMSQQQQKQIEGFQISMFSKFLEKNIIELWCINLFKCTSDSTWRD